MTKILILILLFCFSTEAHAQLPELGWSKERVYKFMEGKYKYKSFDTALVSDVVPGEPIEVNISFTPVLFYGIEGRLLLEYNDRDKVYEVIWSRVQSRKEEKKILSDSTKIWQFESKLSTDQIMDFINAVSKEKGKPKILHNSNSQTDEGYSWEGLGYLLMINSNNDIYYFYSKINQK